jgi:hypothetical protein
LAAGPGYAPAYHLKILGVSYEVFYQEKTSWNFKCTGGSSYTGKFDTPAKVIESYQLLSQLDPSDAELVFEYGDLQVYSIQAIK